MELQRNPTKEAAQNRGTPLWEWYTAKLGNTLRIHVHNKLNGERYDRWSYQVVFFRPIQSQPGGFDTKEDAYAAALQATRELIWQASRRIEEAIEAQEPESESDDA